MPPAPFSLRLFTPGRELLFFFFSNRLGCTTSLLITGLGTLLLLWLMGWLRL